jgi:hypothetical protein
MKKVICSIIFVMIIYALSGVNILFAQNNPLIGTWVLDKSAPMNTPWLTEFQGNDVSFIFELTQFIFIVGPNKFPEKATYKYDSKKKMHSVCEIDGGSCATATFSDDNTMIFDVNGKGTTMLLKRGG